MSLHKEINFTQHYALSVLTFATNANKSNVERLKQGQRKQTTSRL